ncbi:PilW family protein [Variovorax sp. RB3P1]|uniref:PilW family protein n=1 Tax=Variovorax sp. RB3P1 TaxID=3443732 RepID=UPI003F458D64
MIAISRRAVRGLTLIELLVAMAVGLVVVLAAVSALTVARRGFTTVDAASQLRDNGRFAADMIQRIGVQTGYKDVFFAATTRQPTTSDPAPSVMGFNNAKVNLTSPLTTSTAWPTTEAGVGSDVLIMQYQVSQTLTSTADTAADRSMIDCAGNAPATVANVNDAGARDARMASIFSIGLSQGEPSLLCTYLDPTTNTWMSSPIVQGVENFQVLYGVDGVTAGAAPAANAATPDVPNAYLRADQMTVPGSATGTNANWRRVRSLRIGMVLRSATGAAQDSQAQTFYPFGPAKGSANGGGGSAFASNNDKGTVFQPTPDGRLRQVMTFTIHLRNDQGL